MIIKRIGTAIGNALRKSDKFGLSEEETEIECAKDAISVLANEEMDEISFEKAWNAWHIARSCKDKTIKEATKIAIRAYLIAIKEVSYVQ